MDETTEYGLAIHTMTFDATEGDRKVYNHTHYGTDCYDHMRNEFNAMVVDALTRYSDKPNARIEKISDHLFEFGYGDVDKGDKEEYFVRLRIFTI